MSAADLDTSRRGVFAGAPMLLGVAFVMGVVLAVVFPTGHEFAALAGKHRVDAYSIAYLSVLTRAKRDDGHLRLVYARQLASLGRWDAALAELDRETFAPALVGDAEGLRLELMLARAYALDPTSVARRAALDAVHDELRRLRGRSWPPSRARELGALALELEDPGLAARYFLAAAEAEPSRSARAATLADAGRWLRAAGDDAAASECLRRAAETTDDPEREVVYVTARAGALEAGGRPCDAARALLPFAVSANDVALVTRAATLATSCGDVREAKMLGRRILALAPDDEASMRAQVGRELAAGDPPGALVLLRRLVKSRPEDGDLRLTTARVAEWSGQPQVALEHWLFLVSTGRIAAPTRAARR
ncbi:MAG: hypothetical protein KF795_02170 [Labilithrix sp.]|nr:hypothetical protein [Labilithrix sp.]